MLGDRGHIALEVHDNDAMFGEARWGKGAQCRWRNIRIKDLTRNRRNAKVIRTLQPGQRCEVWIASVTGEPRTGVFTTEDVLLEAPNWTLDGAVTRPQRRREALDARRRRRVSLSQVPLTGIPDLNNDHVLDPDGTGIFLSANDGHIYRAALGGGQATRITKDDGSFHFLHGVSPDGQELAYVGIEAGDFTQPGRLMTIPAGGGATARVNVGTGHCDGPEYSPDGEWLYLNTESFT